MLAPGGSVVYGEEAMRNLKARSVVVYLYLPFDKLEVRLGKAKERGVVLRDGQTLKDLFDERVVLYEKYADVIIDESGKKSEETAEECAAALKNKL